MSEYWYCLHNFEIKIWHSGDNWHTVSYIDWPAPPGPQQHFQAWKNVKGEWPMYDS